MSYQWAGRYEEAMAEYQRSLELNPNFEVALAHVGVAYYQTGKYQQALKWFRRYEAVAPGPMEKSRAYSYIAHVYRTLGDLSAAKAPADQALKAGFYSFEPLVVFSEAGDLVKSSKAEKGMFPAPIFNTRGSRNLIRYEIHDRAYLELTHGKTDQGLTDMAEALRHPPATWEIDSDEDCLATAYLRLGRLDEAIAEYQRVLKINPRYPLAHFHIAQAYDRKGETATAVDYYRLFLETWHDADENIPEVIASRNKLQNAASEFGVAAPAETLFRVVRDETGAECPYAPLLAAARPSLDSH
jgi:tetratricopeptide (TPR) repeat protein